MTAVISPQLWLALSMVAAVRSAHGCRGDEFVLACTGISAGRRSLHSDVKGSIRPQPVFTVNYEISLWAAGPRETQGSGLMWDQLERCQAVTCCRRTVSLTAEAFIMLSVFVWSEVHRCVFGHLSAVGGFHVTIDIFYLKFLLRFIGYFISI